MADEVIRGPAAGFDLSLLSLGSLDAVKGGKVGLMLQKAFERLAHDIAAAPDIRDRRKLVLSCWFWPICEDGELVSIGGEFAVGSKTPERVTSAVFELRRDGTGRYGFYFNAASPDSPRQGGLPFGDQG